MHSYEDTMETADSSQKSAHAQYYTNYFKGLIFWDYPIYKFLSYKERNHQDHKDVLSKVVYSPRKLPLSHSAFTDLHFLLVTTQFSILSYGV